MGENTSIPKQPTNTRGDFSSGGVMVVPWAAGMNAGLGYDSAARVSKGVSPATQATSFGNGASVSIEEQRVEIRRVEDVQALQEALDIKSSIGGSYGMFSGSASAEFIRTVSMNAYSLYFLVKSHALVAWELASPLTLSVEATKMTADAFRASYGDYYVSARQRGSLFYGLIEVKTDSQETKSAVLSSLRAAASDPASGKSIVETDFMSGLRNAASHQGVSLTLTVFARGVGAELLALSQRLPVLTPTKDKQ